MSTADNVDFPAPDGPITAVRTPRAALRSIPLSRLRPEGSTYASERISRPSACPRRVGTRSPGRTVKSWFPIVRTSPAKIDARMIRVPLTNVPLRLPRSSTVAFPPDQRTRAWNLEDRTSSSFRSLLGARPMLMTRPTVGAGTTIVPRSSVAVILNMGPV